MSFNPTNEILNFFSKKKRFSLNDVIQITSLDRRKALRVLEKLKKEGFLRIVDEKQIRPAIYEHGPYRRNPTYEISKNLDERRPKKTFKKRDKMYRTLRTLRKATISDLTRLTGCNERTVGDYIRLLAINGFVRAIGKNGKEKIWLLIHDAGPSRPLIPGK